ncbi:phage tail protein [Ensifer sp. MMN_5]|nr:phage tail protein [Ensifer sp. MMN_5]
MTTPYVTGTVSVTAGSAVVTGSGTAWATALIAGGLFGLDSSNGNPVPILSVDSNTQLTLAKPWRGTTAAAQGYWIIRDTAYLQQQTVNAQALSTYIQRLDNAVLADLAGLVPAADKLAYFNGAATAVLADIRAKGRELIAAADLAAARTAIALPLTAIVSSDFDQITDNGWYRGGGATPGNPSGQYGMLEHIQYDANNAMQVFYRGTTNEMWFRRKAASVWQAWVKTNGEMVGTVSQSGGIPTGAIIERGSNANGDYTRFADGTQICTRYGVSFTRVSNNELQFVWAYPAAFSTSPHGFMTLDASGASAVDLAYTDIGSQRHSGGASSASYILDRVTGAPVFVATAAANNCKLAAFGRWF